jgi:hypothetical protein
MKEPRDELVRIDDKGEAHPIGVVASQRMRAREGTYRMLPAPGHVVFMRFTGEDGRRDATDGALVRLSGEISGPGAMCDVLAMIAQSGWRGELVVLDGETFRSIFFEQGFVVGANTTVEEERLGTVLYRFGAINEEQHQLLGERVDAGRRVGEACVELGLVTQEKLFEYIKRQVEEVVFATLTVNDGTFFFLDGFDDGRLATHLNVNASALLMDGVTRLDEMQYFRQKIPDAEYVPMKLEGAGDPPEELVEVYGLIDGRTNLEQLGRLTGRGEFETTKAVYQLVQSKHVKVLPPQAMGGPEVIVMIANSALRTIFEVVETSDQAARVHQNLASFAVGAGVYDILFRNAGPDETGALDAEAVAANLLVVASGSDPASILRQMLYEYVSFALFSAGAALGSQKEAELNRQVAPILTQLRPDAQL